MQMLVQLQYYQCCNRNNYNQFQYYKQPKQLFNHKNYKYSYHNIKHHHHKIQSLLRILLYNLFKVILHYHQLHNYHLFLNNFNLKLNNNNRSCSHNLNIKVINNILLRMKINKLNKLHKIRIIMKIMQVAHKTLINNQITKFN